MKKRKTTTQAQIKRIKNITQNKNVKKVVRDGQTGYSLRDLCKYVFDIDYNSAIVQNFLRREYSDEVIGCNISFLVIVEDLVNFIHKISHPNIEDYIIDLNFVSLLMEEKDFSEVIKKIDEAETYLDPNSTRDKIAERFFAKGASKRWSLARGAEYAHEKILMDIFGLIGHHYPLVFDVPHAIYKAITGREDIGRWFYLDDNPKNYFSAIQLRSFLQAQQKCSEAMKARKSGTFEECLNECIAISKTFSEEFRGFI